MTMELRNQVAVLSDVVSIDEAETLLGWLLAEPGLVLDLSHCEHLHTAVLQLLLYARPAIQRQPDSQSLRSWLAGALNQDSAGTEEEAAPAPSAKVLDMPPHFVLEHKGGSGPADSSLCDMFDHYLSGVGTEADDASPEVVKNNTGPSKTASKTAKASRSTAPKPAVAKSRTAKAKAAKPKAAAPRTTKPKTAKPGTTKPKTTKPGAAKPKTTKATARPAKVAAPKQASD